MFKSNICYTIPANRNMKVNKKQTEAFKLQLQSCSVLTKLMAQYTRLTTSTPLAPLHPLFTLLQQVIF